MAEVTQSGVHQAEEMDGSQRQEDGAMGKVRRRDITGMGSTTSGLNLELAKGRARVLMPEGPSAGISKCCQLCQAGCVEGVWGWEAEDDDCEMLRSIDIARCYCNAKYIAGPTGS